MKCVEMYDGIPFCRQRYNYDGVHPRRLPASHCSAAWKRMVALEEAK